MNDCRRIESELGAYAGGELSGPDHATVRAHLEECASCREELAREKFLRSTLGGLPQVAAPAALGDLVAAAIQTEERNRTTMWKPRRLSAAALVAAAALAVVLLAPGPWNSPEPEWSDQEIAAGREDVLYTLALAAKIIDNTQKDTLVDVFVDKLPQAINDSFKMTKTNNSGGNG